MLRYLRSRIGNSYQVKSDHFDDFIDFNKLATHGFPQKVSSICVDEQLGYVAIGTKDGRLLIFCLNAAAQQLSANFGTKLAISSLYFVTGTNTLVIQCTDSSKNCQHFIRCQITSGQLNFVHLNNERHLKRITCCAMVDLADGQPALLIGTIIGNIYALLVRSMELTEHIVFLDKALKDISEFDSQQREVSKMAMHSEDYSKLYILFNKSIVVFYNSATDEILCVYKSETLITSISLSSATKLLCSHSDGTYSLFQVSDKRFDVSRKRPFGAKACTEMSKIISSKSANSDDEFIIFSDGVPVDELDNRFTLAIFCADKSLILDFDSVILDFCVFNTNDGSSSHILFVLCEDEVVAIDLLDPIWRMLPLPFLHSIHASPVTCLTTVTSLSETAQTLLCQLAEGQRNASYIFSKGSLTLKNGLIATRKRLNNVNELQLVVTGHENGVVNVWLTSEFAFKPWISLNTARDFEGYVDDHAPNLLQHSEEHSENKKTNLTTVDESSCCCLPPVRKAGLFDPYSDDHRLAVQKIFFDHENAEIAVGGRAGQLLVYEGLADSKNMSKNEALLLDMTSSEEAVHHQFNRRLSAESPIKARSVPANYPPGFCLIKNTIAQFKPAVPVTAIAWNSHLGVLAAGNEFGYAIYCPRRREVLLIRTLIPSTDVMQLSSMDGPLSRFKSVKKSIRQSFRRRRRPNEETTHKNFRPAEREIVQRSVNPNISSGETPTSLVKVVTFQQCDVSCTSNCESQHLFVGTHGSVVFIHAVHSVRCPSSTDGLHDQLHCPLVKEIRLQHQAPIVAILYAAEGSSPMGAGRLFVLTEEQIRAFAVPGLRPSTKLRFTATEGSRIKKATIAHLRSRLRRARSPENFIVFSTNRAELYLIPTNSNLKRQYKIQFSEHSDSTAIVSATLSSDGQLFFLRPGGSEFERCSLDNKLFNK